MFIPHYQATHVPSRDRCITTVLNLIIYLSLEMLLFTIFTLINLRGLATAGRVEFLSTVIQISALLRMAAVAFFIEIILS
jgi:amino acid transporter